MGDSVNPDEDLEDELRGKDITRAEEFEDDLPEFWD